MNNQSAYNSVKREIEDVIKTIKSIVIQDCVLEAVENEQNIYNVRYVAKGLDQKGEEIEIMETVLINAADKNKSKKVFKEIISTYL